MSNKRPVVTVILPVYNNEEDVIRSIKSVTNQTFKNWELLIFDDYSSDNTHKIIKEYLEKINDQRIFLRRNKKNMGCYITLNKALLKAKGEFITRIDSDDVFHKGKLGIQVNFLRKNPGKMGVFTHYTRGEQNVKYNCITMMYRRRIIDEVGFYDSVRFGADTEFKLRLFKKYGADSFPIIDKVYYMATIRPNSLTRSADTGRKDIRVKYRDDARNWHFSREPLYMPFPLKKENRPFQVPDIMLP